jgi:hypothetical protein
MNILEDFASGDVYPEMTFGGLTDEQYSKERLTYEATELGS